MGLCDWFRPKKPDIRGQIETPWGGGLFEISGKYLEERERRKQAEREMKEQQRQMRQLEKENERQRRELDRGLRRPK